MRTKSEWRSWLGLWLWVLLSALTHSSTIPMSASFQRHSGHSEESGADGPPLSHSGRRRRWHHLSESSSQQEKSRVPPPALRENHTTEPLFLSSCTWHTCFLAASPVRHRRGLRWWRTNLRGGNRLHRRRGVNTVKINSDALMKQMVAPEQRRSACELKDDNLKPILTEHNCLIKNN